MHRLVVIGGLERMAWQLLEEGARAGVEVEWHNGDVRGRGRDRLDAMIQRADEAVLITDVNSHAGVHLAKQLGSRYGTPLRIVKRPGRRMLRDLVGERAGGSAPPRAASHAA
jgi:hypothetical protein